MKFKEFVELNDSDKQIHDNNIPPTKEQIMACIDLAVEITKDKSTRHWIGLDEEGSFRKDVKRLWMAKKKREVTEAEVIEFIANDISLTALKVQLRVAKGA